MKSCASTNSATRAIAEKNNHAGATNVQYLVLTAHDVIFLLPLIKPMVDTSLLSGAKPRPSLRLFLEAIRLVLPTSAHIWREAWFILVGLHVLQALATQFFAYATDQIYAFGREDILLIALFAAFELFLTFLWSALWTLVICSAILTPHEWESAPLRSRFNQLMVEQVRSLAAVIWRLPLLIVPALVEYVRLAFVPFVVTLDRAYLRGDADALQASRELSRGHFWLLTMTLVVSAILVWMAEDLALAGGSHSFIANPFGVSLGWILTLFINLVCTAFLLELFRGLFRNVPKIEPSTPDQTTHQMSR